MEEKYIQHPYTGSKLVLFGPESTGKTILSEQLARHYDTRFVPEYMRIYLQKKWDARKETCVYSDLLSIAEGQMKLENQLAKEVKNLLFCDTNLLELKVYSETYYNGSVPQILDKTSLENKYDLYLLTYIDTPWVKDDLRDKPHEREEMFYRFKECLDKYDLPYVIVKGDKATRLQEAIRTIDQLIQRKR